MTSAAAPLGGFTIVELLVSMTITLVLVVALLRIFAATTDTWQHGEAQVDAYREARGALQLMARDLSATLQAAYAPVTTATTSGPMLPTLVLQRYQSSPPTNNPPDNGPHNEEVYCLTNIPNAGSSLLCAVGYYCQWLPTLAKNGGNPAVADRAPRAYALMRQYLDSNGTFQRIKFANSASSGTGTGTTPVPLVFKDLFTRLDPGTTVQTTPPAASSTQLAAYIWDLRFRVDVDLNETTTNDGNAVGAAHDHTAARVPYGADAIPYPAYLPPYVEIRFKALSATVARRLEGKNSPVSKEEDWKDDSTNPTYRNLIQPNTQQFILRVPLLNATPQPLASPSPST